MLQQKALVEIRTTVIRNGTPRLVPYKDKGKYTGFTSVYGFLEDAADQINRSGSTKNISRLPVYSDVLYVDFDNQDEAAKEMESMLRDRNISFSMYHSGGRSIHFHVDIEPMAGVNVPDSQKYWMQENAPLADMSIYRHTGMYRLPFTFHAKYPGKQKKLLGCNEGAKLKIENRPIVKVSMVDTDENMSAKEHYKILGRLLHMPAAEGDRHRHALKIVTACKHSGESDDDARRLVGMWNKDACSPPKADWELDKIVRWVYGD
jgi:hypothetical protein